IDIRRGGLIPAPGGVDGEDRSGVEFGTCHCQDTAVIAPPKVGRDRDVIEAGGGIVHRTQGDELEATAFGIAGDAKTTILGVKQTQERVNILATAIQRCTAPALAGDVLQRSANPVVAQWVVKVHIRHEAMVLRPSQTTAGQPSSADPYCLAEKFLSRIVHTGDLE